MRRNNHWMYCFLLAAVFVSNAFAEQTVSTSVESERMAAQQAAKAAMLQGPQEIALRDQAKLALPEGYGFIPAKEAARLMRSVGNQVDAQFMGLITPLDGKHFIITVDYRNEGYVKDDDSKHWDAGKMLDDLKEGTEAGNKNREDMGMPPIQVTRWIETPKYDASVHHLVWSAEVKLKNQTDADPGVNYNTYILGREGYISMNLITSVSTVDEDKQVSAALLAATQFNNGKRYSDFNSSTDKIAEYGLAALVGGFALKKLGLLAVLGGLLLKFKAIWVAILAFLGGLVKRLRGKKDQPKPITADTTVPQLPAPTAQDSSSENKSP